MSVANKMLLQLFSIATACVMKLGSTLCHHLLSTAEVFFIGFTPFFKTIHTDLISWVSIQHLNTHFDYLKS